MPKLLSPGTYQVSLLEREWLTLDEFNFRLASYPYGYSEKRDKPREISPVVISDDTNKKLLKFTAAKSQMLLKILPFILNGLLGENELVLFAVELCQINQILLSPCISTAMLSELDQLISDHLTKFKTLFNEANLIPKHHYLKHFTSDIKRFGPPTRFSCMRFEGLHNTFKKFVPQAGFRNLTKSLSTKYQQKLATQLQSESARTDGPERKKDTIEKHNLLDRKTLYSLKWVQIYGTEYKLDEALVAINALNGNPVFGKIMQIVSAGKSYQIMESYPTLSPVTHCYHL